jgi:Protein of unknown function (DUF1573)
MKRIISVGLLVLVASCAEETNTIEAKTGEVTSSISTGSQNDKEMQESLKDIQKEESARLKKEKENTTTIEFDKLRHDFGDVLPDSDNKTEFKVTNTGNVPLILSNVDASCGCTMPKKPDGPILPGEFDFIEVVFHPKPSQKKEITQVVTVTANTAKKIHKLDIRAFVKE